MTTGFRSVSGLGRRKRLRPEDVARLKPPKGKREEYAYVRRISSFWEMWEDEVFAQLGIRRDARDFLSLSFDRLADGSGLRSFFDRISKSLASKNNKYADRVLKLKGVPSGQAQFLDDFRKRNVSLIKNLGQDSSDKILKLFEQRTASGIRAEQIAPEIQKILDVGKSRAQLIARDQTLKMNGQIQQLNQTAAGVTRYRWWTVLDGSVRIEHQRLHNTVHAWDDPPDTGNGNNHPGDDIQCRCQALPEIDLFEGI